MKIINQHVKSLFQGLFTGLVLVLMFSCENSDVTADQEKGLADLSVKAVSNGDIDIQSARLLEVSSIQVTEAFVGIDEIELESLEEYEEEELEEAEGEESEGEGEESETEHDGEEDEYEWEGPFVLNLITGESTPELPTVEIVAGTYKEFEAELIPIIGDTASIVVKGSVMIDTETIPFEYVYEQAFEFEIENENGFEITAESLNSILVEFDLDSLLADVDFSLAEVSSDGVIYISKDHNVAIASIIESNFESSGECGKDEDDDDELDDDED